MCRIVFSNLKKLFAAALSFFGLQGVLIGCNAPSQSVAQSGEQTTQAQEAAQADEIAQSAGGAVEITVESPSPFDADKQLLGKPIVLEPVSPEHNTENINNNTPAEQPDDTMYNNTPAEQPVVASDSKPSKEELIQRGVNAYCTKHFPHGKCNILNRDKSINADYKKEVIRCAKKSEAKHDFEKEFDKCISSYVKFIEESSLVAFYGMPINYVDLSEEECIVESGF